MNGKTLEGKNSAKYDLPNLPMFSTAVLHYMVQSVFQYSLT